MIPMLLCGGFKPYGVILLCPIFFSLAHLNHFMEIYAKQNNRIKKVVMVIGTPNVYFIYQDISASVVISSRKQQNVEEAAEKLRAKGIEVLTLVCHVSNNQQRKDLIQKTAQCGNIDVIVSNAAANPSVDPILQTKDSVLDKLHLPCKALAAEMALNTRVNCIAPGVLKW
ncbi:Tropinone reductase-like [Arachis hypogaea]|nr:Tropinone reductase-like [Arachis hypogaea]